jgi:hypothetical protein
MSDIPYRNRFLNIFIMRIAHAHIISAPTVVIIAKLCL